MIKDEHKEVPATHRFPDGSKISYWRSPRDGFVHGQLVNKKGQVVGKSFRYLGDTP